MTQPTVYLVADKQSAHIAVHPDYWSLDLDTQMRVWNDAYRMAHENGWVAPVDDDLSVVDEDGTERLPLIRLDGEREQSWAR